MKKRLACLVLACAAALAFAADTPSKGQIGVFGAIYQSDYKIGISFQLTDALKLKPALGFVYVSNPDQYIYESTQFGVKTQVDLLFNLKIASSLSLGIGPRLGFNLDNRTEKYPTFTDKYSDTHFLIGGVAEVQYLFSKSFGAFLDGALSLSLNTSKYDPEVGAGSDYTTTTIDTSTAIGLAFYF